MKCIRVWQPSASLLIVIIMSQWSIKAQPPHIDVLSRGHHCSAVLIGAHLQSL